MPWLHREENNDIHPYSKIENSTQQKESETNPVLVIKKIKGGEFKLSHSEFAKKFYQESIASSQQKFNSIDHSEDNLKNSYGLKLSNEKTAILVDMNKIDIEGSTIARNAAWNGNVNPERNKIKRDMLQGIDCRESIISLIPVSSTDEKEFQAIDGATRLSILKEINVRNIIANVYDIVDEKTAFDDKGTSLFQVHSNQGRKPRGQQTPKDVESFMHHLADSGIIEKDINSGEPIKKSVRLWVKKVCNGNYSPKTELNIVNKVIKNYKGGSQKIVLDKYKVQRVLGRKPREASDTHILETAYLDTEPIFYTPSGKKLENPQYGTKYVIYDANQRADLFSKISYLYADIEDYYNYKIIFWAAFGIEDGKTLEEIFQECIYGAVSFLNEKLPKFGLNAFNNDVFNTDRISFYGACPCLTTHQWKGIYLYDKESGTFDFGKN